jgi:hypothetical protein
MTSCADIQSFFFQLMINSHSVFNSLVKLLERRQINNKVINLTCFYIMIFSDSVVDSCRSLSEHTACNKIILISTAILLIMAIRTSKCNSVFCLETHCSDAFLFFVILPIAR